MKNHELLDMIGEVNEDYVLEAGSNVTRPRFRWGTLAAYAACAALVAAAVYPHILPHTVPAQAESFGSAPVETQESAHTVVQRPGLHSYTLVEAERRLTTTLGDAKAPADGGGSDPAAAPEAPIAGGAGGMSTYGEHGGDVPVQEAAYDYERLMQGMGVPMDGSPAVYPEWFAGAWLDGEQGELLAVGIVEQDRTPELEAQIRGWAGGTVTFHSMKYSQNDLDGLMRELNDVFSGPSWGPCTFGVYVIENRIGLDFFEEPGDEVLSALAELDPEGDAIFIQVFIGQSIALTDGAAKGPAPEPVSTPVAEDERSHPLMPSAVPGGVAEPAAEISTVPSASETSMPAYTENGQPAQYDTLPRKIDDLPQAKYDVINGEEW